MPLFVECLLEALDKHIIYRVSCFLHSAKGLFVECRMFVVYILSYTRQLACLPSAEELHPANLKALSKQYVIMLARRIL